MARGPKWTEGEDQILIKAVGRASENLLYCFYRVSRKVHKTPDSVKQRWYRHWKPYYQEHPEESPFRSINKKVDNGVMKNIPRNKQHLKEHQKKLNKPFRVKFKEALKILFSE